MTPYGSVPQSLFREVPIGVRTISTLSGPSTAPTEPLSSALFFRGSNNFRWTQHKHCHQGLDSARRAAPRQQRRVSEESGRHQGQSGPTTYFRGVNRVAHATAAQGQDPGPIDKGPRVENTKFKPRKRSCQPLSVPIMLRPPRRLGRRTRIGRRFRP